MNRFHLTLSAAWAALALGACATAPDTAALHTAALDCHAIEADLARTAEAQHAAERQQRDAWKAVVPFAVVARYGKSMAAAQESQLRLGELQQAAALRGCVASTQ